MDKIEEAQYKNLRKCFRKNLVKPILGENYYNLAMDVYCCDEETTLDLQRKFNIQNHNIKVYKTLFIISLIANLVLILFKIF